ncbi:MAG: hypothetical protein VR69_00345 [Peptococcaceae bacterium BRH_c4b]|nr:MAG: hypothetical protein VR69_00345 [Peptococcaceae bacterium BRH_c4b]
MRTGNPAAAVDYFVMAAYLRDFTPGMLTSSLALENSTKGQVQQEAVKAANEMDNVLKGLMEVTQNTANKLGSGDLKQDQIKDELKNNF